MTSSIRLARVESNLGITEQISPGKWLSKVELEMNMLSKALTGKA